MTEFKKATFNWREYSFRYWFWVLWAYFCGKVLRQKKYRPRVQDKMMYFSGLPRLTIARVALLMRLWGCRPATIEEFYQEVADIEQGLEKLMPRIQEMRERHQLFNDPKDEWDSSNRFLFVRK